MDIDVIILAAGKGTRMHSDLPKVLHEIGGKPLLQHVVDAVEGSNTKTHIVVGHGSELVRQKITGDVHFVEQRELLGTGHAVAQVLPCLRENALCLVLYGDVPLIKPSTLKRLMDSVSDDEAVGLLTVSLEDPTGYGRIIRDSNNAVTSIVEQKDANQGELAICEVNTGIICARQPQLARWLPALSNENAQGEYYLTDIIAMAVAEGLQVSCIAPAAVSEVEGVNDKIQLSRLERIYQQDMAQGLLSRGATLADPARIDIRGCLDIGRDVFIDVNCVFEGQVRLGNNVRIGPNCVIKDSELLDNVQLLANCVIESSKLGQGCSIGPFGRLRPGNRIGRNAKIGNFVEVKNSVLGEGSKANHLAYIGDADIGTGVNVGAGTIVCNYDGAYKHRTIMGNNVFIGSNSTLVAPLEIKENGFVGAGSTITQTVPESSLAIARGKQKNITGWKRPVKDRD